MKTPVLETERLILRPVALTDAPAIQKYFNNWNIIKNLATVVPWPYPDNGAQDFLENMCLPEIERGNFIVWAVTLKDGNGECIGIVHFRHEAIDDGQRGFWLAEHLQRQGLMTEAVTAVQDYLFFDLKLDKIQVANAISNLRSRRVKEKTGAKFLRYVEIPHHSGEAKSELWEVTRENWTKQRNKSI